MLLVAGTTVQVHPGRSVLIPGKGVVDNLERSTGHGPASVGA